MIVSRPLPASRVALLSGCRPGRKEVALESGDGERRCVRTRRIQKRAVDGPRATSGLRLGPSAYIPKSHVFKDKDFLAMGGSQKGEDKRQTDAGAGGEVGWISF